MRGNMLNTLNAKVHVQREADHQRWTDDGGYTPESVLAVTPVTAPAARPGVVLPVRRVYLRSATA